MIECNKNIVDTNFLLKEQMANYGMMGRETILWDREDENGRKCK